MKEDPLKGRADARIGTVLNGKWRLDRLVGVGGMAAVYAATHRNSKRVAVKILHADVSIDEDIRDRFLREGYVANQVGHAGAVDVLDDDVTEDGAAFLVMELLEGENLDARAHRKGGRLSAGEVLSLMDQVLDTLVAGHAKGIVHRDIKPENVFVTNKGEVKILDFGIARIREVSQGGLTSTKTGFSMGTPVFMAPEQARGRWDEVDARTDIWAVGATMFTLLTGYFVHGSTSTTNEALALAVTARARSIASVLPALQHEVAALIDRALVYERELRWQGAAEMQEAVRRAYAALDGSGGRPPQVSLPDGQTDFPGGTVVVSDFASVDAAPLPSARESVLERSVDEPTADVAPADAPLAQDFASTATLARARPHNAHARSRTWIPISVGGAAVAIGVAMWAFGGSSAQPVRRVPASSGVSGPLPPSASEFAPSPAPLVAASAPVVVPAENHVHAVSVESLPHDVTETAPPARHAPAGTHNAATASSATAPPSKGTPAPPGSPKPAAPADPFSGRY